MGVIDTGEILSIKEAIMVNEDILALRLKGPVCQWGDKRYLLTIGIYTY